MPRGVPKAGFRITKNRLSNGWVSPVDASDLPDVSMLSMTAQISKMSVPVRHETSARL